MFTFSNSEFKILNTLFKMQLLSFINNKLIPKGTKHTLMFLKLILSMNLLICLFIFNEKS